VSIEDRPPRPDRPGEAGAVWALVALGLSVHSEVRLIGSRRERIVGERTVEIYRRQADEEHVPVERTLLERRLPDGSLVMRVSRLVDGGHHILTPRHGTFVISADGSSITCANLRAPSWQWHRPLYAQALPLAATVQGLELLHASAVAWRGRAVGFMAPSGMGKSSLATALAARGAQPYADDVLALECRGGVVMAHPGVPLANVPREQLEALSPTHRRALGRTVGSSGKLHVKLDRLPRQPLPLGALIFLCRSAKLERVSLRLERPPEPTALLGATFMPHITMPTRLLTQLDTCGALAASVPVLRLLAPLREPASTLAAVVQDALSQLL